MLRVSDTDSNGDLKSNKVDITTDKTSVQETVQKFIDGYNALQSKLTSLGKRNSIVLGESGRWRCAGGDSTTRAISNFMSNLITTPLTPVPSIPPSSRWASKWITRVSSPWTKKFGEVVDKNFDQVAGLFGGENGLAAKLTTGLKEYTKTGGLLATDRYP